MAKKVQVRKNDLEKKSYKKPILKKEGSLRDITAGTPGTSGAMIISHNRKSKK